MMRGALVRRPNKANSYLVIRSTLISSLIVCCTTSNFCRPKMAISIGVSGTRLLSSDPPSFSSFRKLFPAPSTVHLSVAASSPGPRVARMVTSATAAKTPASGKREPRGITKPRRVSPEMQAFLGVQEIPRTQALKEIWAYIKQHGLQDPQNKKVIVCDQKLKTIFADKDRVGFLEIAGLISPHFL